MKSNKRYKKQSKNERYKKQLKKDIVDAWDFAEDAVSTIGDIMERRRGYRWWNEEEKLAILIASMNRYLSDKKSDKKGDDINGFE